MEKVLFKNEEEESLLRSFPRTFAYDSGLPDSSDFTRSIQELSICFRNNTLRNIISKTSFTIEELVFPDEQKDLLAMIMLKHPDASIESFKILQQEAPFDYEKPIIRANDGYSLFALDDEGVFIEHYYAGSEFRHAGDSRGETVWYNSHFRKTIDRSFFEKKEVFRGKFILLKQKIRL